MCWRDVTGGDTEPADKTPLLTLSKLLEATCLRLAANDREATLVVLICRLKSLDSFVLVCRYQSKLRVVLEDFTSWNFDSTLDSLIAFNFRRIDHHWKQKEKGKISDTMVVFNPRCWLGIVTVSFLSLSHCSDRVQAVGFFGKGGFVEDVDQNKQAFSVGDDAFAMDTMPPASPECWLNAVNVFSYLSEEQGTPPMSSANAKSAKSISMDVATTACSWMSNEHQKLLALHLASCHLSDIGRPLFMKDVSHECSSDNTSDRPFVTLDNLSTCLTKLSDAGVTTYTHFFSYVNQLCTRLLQEVLVGHYYETSDRLAKSSQQAHEKVEAIVQQHEMLWDNWNERQSELVQFQESFRKELLGQQEQWLKYQTSLQKNHTKALESQHRHIQKMSEAVAKANQTMKPWLAIAESILAVTSQNILNFASCLQFVCGAVCAIFIVTFFSRTRWLRKRLCTIVLVEVTLELGLCFLNAQEDEDLGWLSLVKQDERIPTLRWGANLTLVIVFVGSLLVLLLQRLTGYEEPDISPPADDSQESRLRRLDIIEAELSAILRRQRMLHQQPLAGRSDSIPSYLPHGGTSLEHTPIVPRTLEPRTTSPYPMVNSERDNQRNPHVFEFHDALSHFPSQPRGTNSLAATRTAVTPFDDSLPTPTRNNWASPQVRPNALLPTDSAPPTNETGVQTGNSSVQAHGHIRAAAPSTLEQMDGPPLAEQELYRGEDHMMEERDDGNTNGQTCQASSSLKRAHADGRVDFDENPRKRPRASTTNDVDGSVDGE